MPLVYYATRVLKAEVIPAFIWDIDSIRREKPSVVMLANTIGSVFHSDIARYASENGIPVFALISEGNFRTDGSFNYWGYNTQKQFYQEYICLWSRRTLDFLSSSEPRWVDKMVLTGATGFDRYKIFKFIERDIFLEKYNLQGYNKVIGYAGWAFGKLFNEQGREELLSYFRGDSSRFAWLEDQMHKVEQVLREAIENHPDILFILKRHPNEVNPSIVGEDRNEMVRLAKYPNVLYLKDEEPVHNLINVSDLWVAFESTTALEAWLMGPKTTIFINPDPGFNRDAIYKGTVMVQSYKEFNDCIREFYQTGRVASFYMPDRETAREQIITDTIGFDDGLNHVRAGRYLARVLDKTGESPRKVKLNPRFFVMYLLMQLGKYFYYEPLFRQLPKFKKTVWIFSRFRLKNFAISLKEYGPYLEDFYREKQII